MRGGTQAESLCHREPTLRERHEGPVLGLRRSPPDFEKRRWGNPTEENEKQVPARGKQASHCADSLHRDFGMTTEEIKDTSGGASVCRRFANLLR